LTSTASAGAAPVSPDDARLQRFGATLAHELRAPLAALHNGLNILKRGPAPPEQSAWAIAMMERQVERLSGFIEDLLDAGHLAGNHPQVEQKRVNLADVIVESLESCAAAIAARRQEIVVDAYGADFVVLGDCRRLGQVFINLVSNSIKYTPPGGHIGISIRRADGSVVVEVRDDGSGIAAEDLPHVFEYFQQAPVHQNQACGGLGIGLAIVRSLVRLHGGSVTAQSAGAGSGSRFTVRLPLADAGPGR
jgi:signal transduction histidine kinase